MDVDGLGDKIITQLIEQGLVVDEADIYSLGFEDLISLDKIEKKSAENLLRAIEDSKRTTLARFLFALGIRHVGEHIAKLIANHFGSLENIQQATENDLKYDKDKGTGIKGIGKEIAQRVVAYFEDESNKQLLERLLMAGIEFEVESQPAAAHAVTGKSFVITGSLTSMKRSEAKERIVRKGGMLASSLSAGVDYLVVGQSPGSKLRKAQDLDVTILNEGQFLSMLAEE
jgi:DNA ligase (NAD+)